MINEALLLASQQSHFGVYSGAFTHSLPAFEVVGISLPYGHVL